MKPPTLNEIAAFYDKIALQYNEERLKEKKLFGDFIERPAIMKCLPAARAGRKLLDIGCGSGLYSKVFAQEGFRVTGIDVSSEMIALARNYCRGDDVAFVHTAFQEYFADPASYDVVFGSFLPGYLADLSSAFHRISSWLAPNGTLILSMLHPVRAAASQRHEVSYVLTDYFDRGLYLAAILHGEERFPLVKHLFSDLINAAQRERLILTTLLEPVPENPPPDIDAALFYKCPSIAVLCFCPKRKDYDDR